jgi:CheY-like chemotaxis protein
MNDYRWFSFGKKTEPDAKASEPAAAEAPQTTHETAPVEHAPELVDIEAVKMEEQHDSPSTEHDSASAENAPAETTTVPASASEADNGHASKEASERRKKRRASISAPVRVRSTDLTSNALDDITTTVNVSRVGILLASKSDAYYRSMDVLVTFPHSKSPAAMQAEQPGRVVRISELPDGRRSIAIALGVKHRHDEEFISTNGAKVHSEPAAGKITVDRDPNSLRPLVLAIDGEASTRESLKAYLDSEGYDVITVTNAQEARDVLSQCTPSLLIAEIEGEGMPGYDICAHCKATPRLQRMPVMLTTTSAYPSDYASAHSLGAVVCMAKPYRQERLGHVVKLLAPPSNASENVAPPRPADLTRRHLGNSLTDKTPKPANGSTVNRRFRFGGKW